MLKQAMDCWALDLLGNENINNKSERYAKRCVFDQATSVLLLIR